MRDDLFCIRARRWFSRAVPFVLTVSLFNEQYFRSKSKRWFYPWGVYITTQDHKSFRFKSRKWFSSTLVLKTCQNKLFPDHFISDLQIEDSPRWIEGFNY